MLQYHTSQLSAVPAVSAVNRVALQDEVGRTFCIRQHCRDVSESITTSRLMFPQSVCPCLPRARRTRCMHNVAMATAPIATRLSSNRMHGVLMECGHHLTAISYKITLSLVPRPQRFQPTASRVTTAWLISPGTDRSFFLVSFDKWKRNQHRHHFDS